MNKRVLALLCAVFMTLAATVGMLPFSVSAADKSELTEQRLVMTPDGGVVRPSAPVRTRGAKSSTPVRSEKGAAPAQVVLEGALPADVSAETVNVDPMNYILPTANDILCAYDISLYSAEQEYEPENTEIRVSVSGSMIADAADGSLVVVHIQDDPAAPMELIEDFTLSGDTLTFSTDHFSVFLIVDVDEEGTEPSVIVSPGSP